MPIILHTANFFNTSPYFFRLAPDKRKITLSNKEQKINTTAQTVFASQENLTKSRSLPPSTSERLTLKYDAPLTQDDKKNIQVLFKKLADGTSLSLAFKRKELEILGNKLDKLHPLTVWKYILTTPELKTLANQIKRKVFVWDSLLSEYEKKLKSEYSKGNLTKQNVVDFSKSLNRPIDVAVDKDTNWLQFLEKATDN